MDLQQPIGSKEFAKKYGKKEIAVGWAIQSICWKDGTLFCWAKENKDARRYSLSQWDLETGKRLHANLWEWPVEEDGVEWQWWDYEKATIASQRLCDVEVERGFNVSYNAHNILAASTLDGGIRIFDLRQQHTTTSTTKHNNKAPLGVTDSYFARVNCWVHESFMLLCGCTRGNGMLNTHSLEMYDFRVGRYGEKFDTCYVDWRPVSVHTIALSHSALVTTDNRTLSVCYPLSVGWSNFPLWRQMK